MSWEPCLKNDAEAKYALHQYRHHTHYSDECMLSSVFAYIYYSFAIDIGYM